VSCISHSQAGQELWALEQRDEPGTFLDVGCGQPVAGSNTALLEQLGWGGVLIDLNEEMAHRCKLTRIGIVICADATMFDFRTLPLRHFNYLSLDVDEAQVAALKNILACGVEFDFATIEHDSYRFGEGPRDEIRREMRARGYHADRLDVEYGGNAFEDWWTWVPRCL
jgi:hypothetical protein